MRQKLAVGNWKMNGLAADLEMMRDLPQSSETKVVICPPAPLLMRAVQIGAAQIGAQDCHAQSSGAYTGDISAQMVADAGGRYVIVGHSERRAAYGESDAQVRAKAQAAIAAGLIAIICIGESEAERDAGQTLDILAEQLNGSCPDNATPANIVIAYEPIWAIGTGRIPHLSDICQIHDFLREKLISRFGEPGKNFSLLYGGSVKPDNSAMIFEAENVDGALVGGASLKATDFGAIITALERS